MGTSTQRIKEKYLKIGVYTRGCPRWLLQTAKKIPHQMIDEAYINKVLQLIRREFNPHKHIVSTTNCFELSRFIPVAKILKLRLRSCGAQSTVVAAILRRLGIPTKLVDGMFIKDNPEMRHAWNEIYLERKGTFVPFDITRENFKLTPFHVRKGEWVDWSELKRAEQRNKKQ